MIDQSQAQNLIGQTLHTSDNDKVGKIGQIYLDDVTGAPEWATVNTGLFGTNESFVPLSGATLISDGITVPYGKDLIKDAPNISDAGHLSEDEERRLYEHYDVSYTGQDSTFADTSRTGYAGTDTETRTNEHGTEGYDTSGPTTDSAMTRSEEQLNVGTERVQTGKARLRKWVETETVQVDVPVRTEKAVLVTEPITDANRGDALGGPDISEEEHEIVLNAERPVVTTETVAKERVRLDTQVEESVETVGGDVRKERIELEDDTTTERSGKNKH